MKFRFIWVGKTKNKNWLALQDDYLQRLGRFVKFEITELKDDTKEAEGKKILESLNANSFLCVLDVLGKEISSHDLAKKIETWQNESVKEIAFVIGGFAGLSPKVVGKADFNLSLSRLTLTHEAARVVLTEQIYRAFTIINNFPYQK
jgi:23S rRNA (pseudouridine1915-N3)-methyltransferase